MPVLASGDVAFATAADLADRLGQDVPTGTTLLQWESLLADATAHLRGIIGWQVYPQAEVTQRFLYPTGTRLPLPGLLASLPVPTVTIGGSASTDWSVIDGALYRAHGWYGDVEVTYTVGYADPPADLVSWCCVLASQMLASVTDLGSLASGDVSSVSIDDFRKAWASGGESNGVSLPGRVEDALRARYGVAAFVA